MKEERIDKDVLPDPPNPINKALPLSKFKILDIFKI
jgi:hypothetical protein